MFGRHVYFKPEQDERHDSQIQLVSRPPEYARQTFCLLAIVKPFSGEYD
jgi:hypothetical protein